MYDYNDRFELSEESAKNHKAERKQNLTTLEKIGLEKVLCDFVKDYEETVYGETYGDLSQYTRYNESSVDILDGVTDTYIFDHYAINEIWVTNYGGVILSTVDLEQYIGDEPERYEEEKDDIFSLPNNFDIWSDFEEVLFKLN